ncbi:MAG: hypothetical protein JNJ54_33785 [Myxococcaceae bacterium]|nr:hypothetical protein [Myxococcaceae bacterium]
MPGYLWMARTPDGAVHRGELEAEDAAAVQAQLSARGLTSIAVRKKSVLHTRLAVPDVVVSALWAGLLALLAARWAPPVFGLTPDALALIAALATFVVLVLIGRVRRRR